MQWNMKRIISSLTFGIVIMIIGIVIYKMLRTIGIDFNNEFMMMFLLVAAGAITYGVIDYFNLWNYDKTKISGGSLGEHNRFSRDIEVGSGRDIEAGSRFEGRHVRFEE